MEAVGPDRVLAFMRVTATGRASGIPHEARTGNVYDLADGKIERIRIFIDRSQALEAASELVGSRRCRRRTSSRLIRAVDAFNRRDLYAFLALRPTPAWRVIPASWKLEGGGP